MATAAELALLIKARDTASAQLKKLQKSLGDVEKSAKKAGQSFKIAAVGGGVGAMAGAALSTGFAFNILKENAELAFTTLLGDGGKARAMIAQIEETAKKTPFSFEDLTQASQRMLAFGFAADDVLPTITAVGDAVSAMGGGAEMIQRVTLALGQMMTKGKVSGEEMLQLAEAGIPAWQILAENIGEISPRMAEAVAAGRMTTAQLIPRLMKMAEAGKLPAAAAVAALRKGMAQRFGGLGEKQSKTVAGAASTFMDTLKQLLGELSAGPFAETAGAMLTLAGGLDAIRDHFKGLPEPIKTALSWLGTFAVAAVGVGGAAVLTGGNLTELASAVFLVGRLAPLIGVAFTAMTGPIGLAILGIGALALAWATDFLGIRTATLSAVKWLGDRFGDLIDAASDLARDVGRAFADLTGTVGSVVATGWGYVVSLFEWVGSTALDVLNVWIGLWVLAFQGLVDLVGPIVSAGWGYVVNLFGWLGQAAAGPIQTLVAYVAGAFQWLSDTVGGILQAGWSYVAGLFDGLGAAVMPSVAGTVTTVADLFAWVRDVGVGAIDWLVGRVAEMFGWLGGAVLGPLAAAWTAVVRIFEWVRDTGYDAIRWMVDKVVGLFTWLGDRVRAIWGPIADLVERAGKIGAGVIGAVTGGGGGGGAQGFVNGQPIPRLAGGGLALSPALAMVGDVPEAIVPLSRLDQFGGGRSMVNTFNNYGVLAGDDAERWILGVLDKAGRKGY